MFTNLIESASHAKEYKRRSSFFLVTVAAYSVILFAAGIVSVYTYDAQLEAQTSSLELLNWVPPVTPTVQPTRTNHPQPARRSAPSNAPVDRNIAVPERRVAVAPTSDPRVIPNDVSVKPYNGVTVTGPVRLTNRDVDPPFDPSRNSGNCLTCSGTSNVVQVEPDGKPPEPPPVKPSTQRVTSVVLQSKVISLPQPAYPMIAKQTRK